MSEAALDVLAAFHSWQLNRVSPNTYPADVVVTLRRGDQVMSDAEAKAVAEWIRSGTCYRCRIGKGRFFFGDTPLAAAKRAAANAGKDDRK